MPGRKSKLFAAILALALNVTGGPMAWARMSTAMHDAPAKSMSDNEHCAGHLSADDSERQPSQTAEHPSCCEGGSCTCGGLPASALTVAVISQVSAAPDPANAMPPCAVPHGPLDESLRPPISYLLV
jgi:hypothetical protein